MYAGFITVKRTSKRLGIHQRFDSAAYRLMEPYLANASFPELGDILSFEGYNGPDGLKVKSPGAAEPSHLYDPATDTGEVPFHINNHYRGLVSALRSKDRIRAAFEAAWLAHFVCDGLTPAHHFPLDERRAALVGLEAVPAKTLFGKLVGSDDNSSAMELARRTWAIWGGKGLMSTHHNFEMGIAATVLLQPLRIRLDPAKLAEARRIGMLQFFKAEARAIADLELYDRFYRDGWTVDIARIVRTIIAPATIQAIGIIWLLAYLEADMEELAEANR